ncbi:MAG: hypothetical protein V7L27_03775 [Nostoc sp.]|uniref:hypothetical protein n=1 Tax=Nostoc sp. TaxID=1180 RepID=UPI002FFB10A5
MNHLYRSLILIGLTLPIPLGILAPPVFAQTGNRVQSPVATSIGVHIFYNFPKEGITYLTNGPLNYKGRNFPPNEINIVTSAIGKEVTVKLANGIDTLTTFTLLLPNSPIPIDAKITAVGITDNFLAPSTNNDSYILLNGTASTVIVSPPTN